MKIFTIAVGIPATIFYAAWGILLAGHLYREPILLDGWDFVVMVCVTVLATLASTRAVVEELKK